MGQRGETVAFVGVLLSASMLAVAARWVRRTDGLPDLPGWALADRSWGAVVTWFLLGGSIFTAYTFAAVPGLVFAAGGIGFFPFVYTVVLCPVLIVVLPRLWTAARRVNAVTVADWVRSRYDSPALMLAVALTGVLATMPYIALQLLGVRAVLIAGGLYPQGLSGDLALTTVFAVLAVATYRSGLRAPTVISLLKGALVFGATIGVLAVALGRLGGPEAMFLGAEQRLAETSDRSLLLDPRLGPAFVSLALGSALALPMYPHVLTAAFAASGPTPLRRGLPRRCRPGRSCSACSACSGWQRSRQASRRPRGEPRSRSRSSSRHPAAGGQRHRLRCAGVGALVPAAVMAVAAATLFTRTSTCSSSSPWPRRSTRYGSPDGCRSW